MKCWYKYCKYGCTVEKSEAFKDGSKYYHKECYKNKEYLKQIVDIYSKYYIYKTKESYSIVHTTIKQLLEKEYSMEYILFTLCQVIKNSLPLNSVLGLHYYVNDKKIKDKYEKTILSQRYGNIDVNKIENEKETEFKYTNQEKENKWGSILG